MLYLMRTRAYSLVLLAVFLPSCSSGGLFSGGQSQATKSKQLIGALQATDEIDIESYLSSEENLSDAFGEIEDKTLIDLLDSMLELYKKIGIKDEEHIVKDRPVSDLYSNTEQLRDLIEEDPNVSVLTLLEILELSNGGLDSILDYGYEGFSDELGDRADTYADGGDAEEMFSASVKSVGDGEETTIDSSSPSKTKTDDKTAGSKPEKPAASDGAGTESSTAICKANRTGRGKLSIAPSTSFTLAIAVKNFCEEQVERKGLKPSKNARCLNGTVGAGVGTIAGASAVLARFAIDSANACSGAQDE